MLLAGIDIGTLTCRLLIADVSTDLAMKEIESDRQILRLGEGVDEKRCLSPAAMSRVVKTLCEWRDRMEVYPLAGVAVVATSAVREATNREEFVANVKSEAGFEVEILNGDEEARRTLLGIQSGLPAEVDEFLGIDIGGGSTEFMRAHNTKLIEQPHVYSLDLGVVRLTEREFHTDDPPSDPALFAAEEVIQGELEKIRGGLGDLSGMTCVGTAGTITTLAAMAQKLSHYESARIHNYRLSLEKIQQLEKELRRRTRLERRDIPGLEQGREDVIVAGTVILRVVIQTLGFQECLVSDYGLREGILVHEANRLRSSKSKV
ncbi:MAG: Ppx/GppA family phosphatase [Nitrospirota bacterium]|nr:MAG: Ppx/GppA family phosphatase [Nitrospirota bacterium]